MSPNACTATAMSTLRDRVLFVIAGRDPEFWPRDIPIAAAQGGFDLCEALTELQTVQRPSVALGPAATVRRIPRVRQRCWDERPEMPTGRFVRVTRLDPVLDWRVSDGAARCLQLVVSLAGGVGQVFVTLTCSVAKQLGRTTRTVQNYWRDLTAAGYLHRSFDRKTGLVTVLVIDTVAPVARVEPPPPPEEKPVWPRPPAPQKAGKTGFRAGLRKIVGAKLAARINGSENSKSLNALLPTFGKDFDRDMERAESFFGAAPEDRKALLR